jgi:hypothetical protein
MIMRWQGISPVVLLLLGAALTDAGAQTRYDLALRFAYVHTFDTNPLLMPGPSTGWGNGNDLFAETELSATGEHRDFNLRYMYGRQDNPEIVNQNTNIHQLNFSFTQDFSPTVHFSLTDFATYSNDYTPNEVYSGEASLDPADQNPPGVYIGRVDQLQNLANVELRWEAAPRSEVRLLYANRLFHYGASSTGMEYSDTVQNILEAGYRYRFTSHVSAGLLYRYQYIDFTAFDNTQSHAVLGSVGWQVRPTVSLDGAAGPITTDNTGTGDSEVFLNARVSLIKNFEHDIFSVIYARDLANTDGVFGASMADVVYLTWGRRFFGRLDWSFHGGFSRQQVLESPTSTENWFAATGLRYQLNQYLETYAVYRWTQQTIEEAGSAVTLRHQVLLGVRFSLPHVWRKEG